MYIKYIYFILLLFIWLLFVLDRFTDFMLFMKTILSYLSSTRVLIRHPTYGLMCIWKDANARLM